MDLESQRNLLKKIKIGSLEPALQEEVFQLAREMEYESAIKSSSNLHFLFKIYQAEKVKRRRSEKLLKKAENLILRLATLHQGLIEREVKEKKEKKPRLPAGVQITISQRMRTLFHSIGIDDEKVMVQAIELLGDKKIESRIDLIHASRLGDELVKKLFGMFPDMLLLPDDDAFIVELETLENKRDMLDSWSRTEGPLPKAADYRETPDILLDDYQDIVRILRTRIPKPSEETLPEYRGKPMHPEDFEKVIMALGFSFVRRAKHGNMYRNEQGVMMAVQIAHKKQMMLNAGTIKKKLQESGISLNEFEKARRGLKL